MFSTFNRKNRRIAEALMRFLKNVFNISCKFKTLKEMKIPELVLTNLKYNQRKTINRILDHLWVLKSNNFET